MDAASNIEQPLPEKQPAVATDDKEVSGGTIQQIPVQPEFGTTVITSVGNKPTTSKRTFAIAPCESSRKRTKRPRVDTEPPAKTALGGYSIQKGANHTSDSDDARVDKEKDDNSADRKCSSDTNPTSHWGLKREIGNRYEALAKADPSWACAPYFPESSSDLEHKAPPTTAEAAPSVPHMESINPRPCESSSLERALPVGAGTAHSSQAKSVPLSSLAALAGGASPFSRSLDASTNLTNQSPPGAARPILQTTSAIKSQEDNGVASNNPSMGSQAPQEQSRSVASENTLYGIFLAKAVSSAARSSAGQSGIVSALRAVSNQSVQTSGNAAAELSFGQPDAVLKSRAPAVVSTIPGGIHTNTFASPSETAGLTNRKQDPNNPGLLSPETANMVNQSSLPCWGSNTRRSAACDSKIAVTPANSSQILRAMELIERIQLQEAFLEERLERVFKGRNDGDNNSHSSNDRNE